MKRTTACGIGILCLVLTAGTLLFMQTGGISHVTDLAERIAETYILRQEEEDTVPADASGEKGYILKEEDGYVVVYRPDSREVYERTGIAVSTLPERLQEEVAGGIHMEDHMELYGFLESYSS